MKMTHSFKALIFALLSAVFLLPGCATTGANHSNEGGSRFSENAVTARINACYATSKGTEAHKLKAGAFSTLEQNTVTFSGAKISRSGVLELTAIKQTQKRHTSADNATTKTIASSMNQYSQVPLAKVGAIMVSPCDLKSGDPKLTLNKSASASSASLAIKKYYEVSTIATGIKNKTTLAGENNWGQHYSTTDTNELPIALVAAFDSHADAVTFAHDFQTLVSKYQNGVAPSLDITPK